MRIFCDKKLNLATFVGVGSSILDNSLMNPTDFRLVHSGNKKLSLRSYSFQFESNNKLNMFRVEYYILLCIYIYIYIHNIFLREEI